MTNNDHLRSLATHYKLKRKDIALLLSSEYGATSIKAVESWLYNTRDMPGTTLELLILKLKYDIVE